MTPEAQRIAIAEACGWRNPQHPDTLTRIAGWWSQDRGVWWLSPSGGLAMLRDVPDYLNDLNAMHEAEKTLRHVADYWNALWTICRKAQGGTEDLEFDIMRATAAQRAEAFLRTIGKWEEKAA